MKIVSTRYSSDGESLVTPQSQYLLGDFSFPLVRIDLDIELTKLFFIIARGATENNELLQSYIATWFRYQIFT